MSDSNAMYLSTLAMTSRRTNEPILAVRHNDGRDSVRHPCDSVPVHEIQGSRI